MTPIERACRALAELHGRDPDEPVLLTDRLLWQDFEPQVRVVAAAFREPSHEMIEARRWMEFTPHLDNLNTLASDDEVAATWRDQIDALLGD